LRPPGSRSVKSANSLATAMAPSWRFARPS
jgi:hypothetical protein